MKTRNFAAGVAALVITAAVATSAAVTFDPATGMGFVGKGDVQTALGLNNDGLQAVASGLTFTYADLATYEQECSHDTGKKIMYRTVTREQGVSGTVAYDARKRNQVNGFTLLGFSGQTSDDGNGGGPCNDNGNGWEPIGEPTLVSSTGGGLKVNGVPLQ
jgi:hypothetical protein